MMLIPDLTFLDSLFNSITVYPDGWRTKNIRTDDRAMPLITGPVIRCRSIA